MSAGTVGGLPRPTKLLTPAEVVAGCRESIRSVGWRNPFFLIPSRYIFFRADPSVPTACVDIRGVCYVSPIFMSAVYAMDRTLWDFVVAHEVFHPLFEHMGRRGNRNPARWNRACDRWINDCLSQSGIGGNSAVDRLQGLKLLKPEHRKLVIEELYEEEPEEPQDTPQRGSGRGQSGDGQPAPGQGCGQVASREGQGAGGSEPGEGEGDPGQFREGKLPSTPPPGQDSDLARKWREAAAQAVLQAGTDKGSVFARLTEIPPPRVRWSAILRGACARAIASHGHDDVSYRRINRRSYSGATILPGGIAYSPRVAVIIDTSGSVPDSALATAVAEVKAIAEATPGIAFYLVTHDATVQWQGWVRGNPVPKTRAAMRGRGGTCFDPAYRAIEDTHSRFDAVVHLTDGVPCDTWPMKPRNTRHVVVALIGYASRTAIPTGYRVVEVEV